MVILSAASYLWEVHAFIESMFIHVFIYLWVFNYILAEPSAHPENSLEIANLYARCFSWKHEDLQGFTRSEKIESAIVEAVEMEICKGHYEVSVVFSIFIISRVLSLVLRCLSEKGKVLSTNFPLHFSLLHSRVRRYGLCICRVCYSLKALKSRIRPLESLPIFHSVELSFRLSSPGKDASQLMFFVITPEP